MAHVRVILVVFCAVSFLALMPGSARAGEPKCQQRLIHDWYADGKIQGRYRVVCYHAALADVPSGDLVYGTLRTDLTQALSSGIDRVKEEGVIAGPETVLPEPTTRLAAPTLTKSDEKPYSVLEFVAIALLVVVLLLWCVDRWRRRGLRRP